MGNSLRTFIAIELSESMREVIAAVQKQLKKSDCDIKWVKPQSAHITLKFLGDTSEDKLNELKKVLKEVAEKFKPFSFAITELGVFPSLTRPNIIWIGVSDEANYMQNIAALLENELEKLGFQKENRSFKSHITIGRVKNREEYPSIEERIGAIRFKAQSQPQSAIISHSLKARSRPAAPSMKPWKNLSLLVEFLGDESCILGNAGQP